MGGSVEQPATVLQAHGGSDAVVEPKSHPLPTTSRSPGGCTPTGRAHSPALELALRHPLAWPPAQPGSGCFRAVQLPLSSHQTASAGLGAGRARGACKSAIDTAQHFLLFSVWAVVQRGGWSSTVQAGVGRQEVNSITHIRLDIGSGSFAHRRSRQQPARGRVRDQAAIRQGLGPLSARLLSPRNSAAPEPQWAGHRYQQQAQEAASHCHPACSGAPHLPFTVARRRLRPLAANRRVAHVANDGTLQQAAYGAMGAGAVHLWAAKQGVAAWRCAIACHLFDGHVRAAVCSEEAAEARSHQPHAEERGRKKPDWPACWAPWTLLSS